MNYTDRPSRLAKAGKIIWGILFVLYLALLSYLTMYSRYYGRGYDHRSMNLVPLRTITQYLNANINRNIIVTNLLGNVAAFMPFGFLLPLVFSKFNGFFKVALLSAGFSFLIEAVQYILAVGAADIDDLILNTVGGIIGFLIFSLLNLVFSLIFHRKRSI